MSRETVRQLQERLKQDDNLLQRLLLLPRYTLRTYDLTEEEKQPFIVPNFGWMIENQLAGTSYPHSDDALSLLAQFGVKALLNLAEKPLNSERLIQYGLQMKHVPVPNYTAPTIEQVEQAIATIDELRSQDLPVAVHCAIGLGRTGTVLACYFVSQGYSAGEAIELVRNRRPGSIQTPEQEEVIELYEQRRVR